MKFDQYLCLNLQSDFGKMNSTLGSVVPLAMFFCICLITFMDDRKEEFRDPHACKPPQRKKVSINSMKNSLQSLSLIRVSTEEQPKKLFHERFVHHRLQAVWLKVRMFENGEKDGVGQGKVPPHRLQPLVLLLKRVWPGPLFDVRQRSEDVGGDHLHKIADHGPAHGGQVLPGEVKQLFKDGGLLLPVVLHALLQVEPDAAKRQLLGQQLLLLFPLCILAILDLIVGSVDFE